MQSSNEITNRLKENWENIKKQIRIESGITDVSFRTWIDPLSVYNFQDNTVKILIPQDNPMTLQYISKNYQDFFKVTISEFLEEMVDISFILNKDIINNEETPQEMSDKFEESQYSSNSTDEQANL